MAPVPILVDDDTSLSECLLELNKDPNVPLAIDAEGENLGRHGVLCILQIYPSKGDKVYLIDFTTMGAAALEDVNDNGQSLKALLEGDRRKIIFDVRADANAQYHHYGIQLGGMYDLQLLEIAARTSRGDGAPHVFGLGKCITNYGLTGSYAWQTVKDAGLRIFAPERGGSYKAWKTRPLHPALVAYSAQDVSVLFDLEDRMAKRIIVNSAHWDKRIEKETKKRIEQSEGLTWIAGSRNNAIAPGYGWGK